MANFNINKLIIGGRITEEPKLKTTPNGISVVSFSIAVNRRHQGKQGEQKQADFFTVTAWRQTAEFITRYFHKGSCICISGSIQNRSYEKDGAKRYFTEILADEAYFVESKGEGRTEAPPEEVVPQFETLKDDEELPF